MIPHSDYIIISSELLKAIPSLDGKHFFTESPNPADNYIMDAIDVFPKNPYQEYQAPMPDFHWPQGSEIHQGFDRNLVKIQERQAHTTRPLDEFAVRLTDVIHSMEILEFAGFIHHIRSQLIITARQIQQMRMENYACALAKEPVSTSRNETTFIHQEITTGINVENNVPPAPSTTNESINPLNIPEIRYEIGHYLKESDWLNCSLVCKDWNQTFSKLLYSAIRIGGRSNPSLETLYNKSELIRSFSIDVVSFDTSLCFLVMPNLRVLYFDIDDDSTDIAAALGLTTLIERCEHIAELKMSLRAKPNNSKFWKAVKNSPLLGRLSILRYQVLHQESKDKPLDLYQELQGFWDACSRLEKLGISNFEYLTNGGRSVEINWDKPGLAASRLLSHRTFPHLRHLEISQCKTNVNSQVLLMTRCPNLERLEWDLIHLGDYNVDGPIRDLCQYFKEGNSPNLKALDFSTIPGRDTIFADVLRSLDGRPMERLGFRYTAFGRLAIKELERFYPTLQVLDLTRCSDMSSSCILNILISCPILRDMKAHIIQAEDLDPRQSWSCHRTLRSLSTTFELESTSDTSDVTTHQSLCERVYSTLSHLRELEYLSIDQEEDVSVPLDVNLSHGLWKLSELKKLKRFEIGSLFTSISIKEIYWMLINWPKLIRIQELYNEDLEDIAIRIFKRRGIKYD